ncbi:MAG: hypothetical protein ABL880_04855 [Methylotenera sp.]
MSNYQLINCEFLDVIEACATLQKRTTILEKNSDGTHRFIHTIISDVLARDEVEYLNTQYKQLIHLDELLAIDNQEVHLCLRKLFAQTI